MQPLVPRIKAYLDNHASQWVPVRLITSIAQGKGYSYDDIRSALSDISNTAPYACVSIQKSDVHRIRELGIVTEGVYYKRQPMTAQEIQSTREAIAYFDSI